MNSSFLNAIYSMNSVALKARQSKENLQAKVIRFTLRGSAMKVGDLVKWTEETGEIYLGVVTSRDKYYVGVNWIDGDSGYYSVFVIEQGMMEKVCK
jgi:hypothetical protein